MHEATTDLVRFLARRIDALPLLMIVSCRDTVGADPVLSPVVGDLVSTPGARRMQLTPLSRAAVTELLEGHLLDPADVHQRTAGNPFFVSQIIDQPDAPLPESVRDARCPESGRDATEAPPVEWPAMIVYPAVDIRNGRCVQLTQGRPDTEVVHHDDPAAQAALWVSLGADAIHVVNLDGALSYGAGTASALNLERVQEIRGAVDVPVQFAGGLRGERDIETAIGLDVDRIVIGTAAVVRPELVAWALRRWGADRVAVALEVKGGQVVTHGWQQTTPLTPVPFGQDLYRMGVRTALYTDVDREGLLGGVDAAGAVALAEATGLRLVISGGVGGIDDIRALANAGDAVEGVVIGQALYTGRLSLPEALAAAA